MEVEWDERKRKSNANKHGVDFTRVHDLNWEHALTLEQQHGDEKRFETLAPIEDRLYVLVWTQRSKKVRVISFRKANKREVRRYVQTT